MRSMPDTDTFPPNSRVNNSTEIVTFKSSLTRKNRLSGKTSTSKIRFPDGPFPVPGLPYQISSQKNWNAARFLNLFFVGIAIHTQYLEVIFESLYSITVL